MARTTIAKVNDASEARESAIAAGFSADGVQAGFTIDNLAESMVSGIAARFFAFAFLAAHLAAGLKRDAVLMALGRAGIGSDNVTDYIGANDGAMKQRVNVIEALTLCGIPLNDAGSFQRPDVRERLALVQWTVVREALDVVKHAHDTAKDADGRAHNAWRSLLAYHDADASGRAAMVRGARQYLAERAVEAQSAAVEALEAMPPDAPAPVLKEAEQAVKAAKKEAERAVSAAERAEKREANRQNAASERTVGFTTAQYDALSAHFDQYNAKHRRNGAKVNLAEYVLMSAEIAASHGYATK
jgi:hypothetical protein